MAQGHRPDRVGDQIRQELSELLSRGAVHDPGIGFITFTRVRVSPDLQLARVFYTSLGDEAARRQTARALERATPFFRRRVGARLQLRRVPELEFRFDQSIQHQDRIEQILRDLHAEEAARAGAAPHEPEGGRDGDEALVEVSTDAGNRAPSGRESAAAQADAAEPPGLPTPERRSHADDLD